MYLLHCKKIDIYTNISLFISYSKVTVMQFNMELLFQLRELLLKIQYCLIQVILIFNLQFIPY